MADIKLNSDHDFSWQDFRKTEDNAESVSQKIKIRLRRYLGEYFLDTTKGIPYFQELMKKGVAKNYVDLVFIEEIANTEGVLSVDIYESEISFQGVYAASFVATTTEGVTFQFNVQPISLQ